MLDKYVESPRTLARFRASPVGTHLDGFAAALSEWGYAWKTVGSWLHHAVHVGRWAIGQSITIEALDEHAVTEFERHLSACVCPFERGKHRAREGAAARMFLRYLRGVGIAAPAAAPPPSPHQAVLDGFHGWMRRHRGATESTVRFYSRTLRRLLDRIGDEPSRYAPQAIRASVLALLAGHDIRRGADVVSATRAFLSYEAAIGRCSPDLIGAVPTPAAWKQTTLPRYLPDQDVEKLIASCAPATAVGRRDRAVLLLLARLGVRAGDVVALRLGDIDWRDSTFKVAGKGRREVRLPLPQEVGDALLAYLEHARPRVGLERVFLTVHPPWRPFTSSSTVSCIVARALKRAGVDASTRGAHLLRHSAATTMLRDGASLAGIGVVLRHRSVETTAQYARVDGQMLQEVAQPWPEPGEIVVGAPVDATLLCRIAQQWPEVPPC